MKQARGNDTNQLKGACMVYLDKNFKGQVCSANVIHDSSAGHIKETRGWKNPATAQLLLPMKHELTDEYVRRELRTYKFHSEYVKC